MNQMLVVFSHGLESGPWGTKINRMAEVARANGADVMSVDYQGIRSPDARVEKLLATLNGHSGSPLLLVGSSMGGHVATAAAASVRADGLFVLAPAFHMPGFEAITPEAPSCPMEIVHGWHDDVVPVENSIRFAREASVTLHIVDSDHRLASALDGICEYFDRFIKTLK